MRTPVSVDFNDRTNCAAKFSELQLRKCGVGAPRWPISYFRLPRIGVGQKFEAVGRLPRSDGFYFFIAVRGGTGVSPMRGAYRSSIERTLAECQRHPKPDSRC